MDLMSIFGKKRSSVGAQSNASQIMRARIQEINTGILSPQVLSMSLPGDKKRDDAALPHDAAPRTEPIIAYRAWSYNLGRLGGIAYQEAWNYRKPMRAQHAAHQSIFGYGYHAGASCDNLLTCQCCGIYGFKDVKTLSQVFEGDFILGRVALWGKIVEHQHGYRAEYAYPQMLFTHNPRYDRLIRAMAGLYGIDVAPLPADIAHEYNALREVREAIMELKGEKQNG